MSQDHVFKQVVARYFCESNVQLGRWLQGLHGAVSSKELSLPEWCRTATFAALRRTVRDDTDGRHLFALLRQLGADERSVDFMVFPTVKAQPDVAAVLSPSILMLVGCNMCEGLCRHNFSVVDNFASTDVNGLWKEQGRVINQELHNTAVRVVGTENPHVLRVAFDPKAAGVVRVTENEVHVVISSSMLEAAFVGVPWAPTVPRLLNARRVARYVRVWEANEETLERYVVLNSNALVLVEFIAPAMKRRATKPPRPQRPTM